MTRADGRTTKKRREPAASSIGNAPRSAEPTDAPEKRTRWMVNLAIQLAFLALAFVTVFGFVRAANNDQMRALCSATCTFGPAYTGRNRTAPDFTLPDLNGQQVSLSSYRGKVVILNFWASWCEPCREEMPAFARLALMLEGRKDIALVTVSTDEDIEAAKDTLATLFAADEELKQKLPKGKIPFPVLLDPEVRVVTEKYGTTKYPETWIIDEDGFIRARFDGARDWGGARGLSVLKAVERGPGCLAEFKDGKPANKLSEELCFGQ